MQATPWGLAIALTCGDVSRRVGLVFPKLMIGLVFFVSACAHGPPKEFESAVLSLQDLYCATCGDSVVENFKKDKRIYKPSFNLKTTEVRFHYDPAATDPDRLAKRVEKMGFKAVVGSGLGSYAADIAFPDSFDFEIIAGAGQDVDILRHLAIEKTTVVEFYAPWCGPCRDTDKAMRMHMREDPSIAMRKVNVVDWSTPAAARYLGEVSELPLVIVFDKNGDETDRFAGFQSTRLAKALAKARKVQ